MIILAGDIGGTKTWLQVAEYSPGADTHSPHINNCFTVLFEQRFVSAQYASFDDLLQQFMAAIEAENIPFPVNACIGVAGPVQQSSSGESTAKVTNLPWVLNSQQLATRFHLNQFRLINDFQAIAHGLEMLADNELEVIQRGDVGPGTTVAPKIVIGAGTGLGQALLVWNGAPEPGRYEVIASEGGHADFAPGSPQQRQLLNFLATQESRVSVEDVLSGRGLINIYDYLAHMYPADVSKDLTDAMKYGDAPAVLSGAGLSSENSLAGRALALFVEVYGTQAGNFALSCLATGGVFIAGGIAAKIRKAFSAESFLASFHDKGPMRAVMQSIPVKLVLNPQVGLKGAAVLASQI